MQNLFSSEFYKNNRKLLQKSIDATIPIVIAAHGLLQRSADNTFTFEQESNFWYLTGINEPDLILVIDESEEYIIIPARSGSREVFDGAVDTEELTRISDITKYYNEEEGWQRLATSLQQARKVQTLAAPMPYIEQYGIYTNPARARCIERLEASQSELEIIDIREQLAGLRIIKQPEEIAALQVAIDVTAQGIQSAAKAVKLQEYTHEFEIENHLTTNFRTAASSGHAFAPIVACGKRACTLHNVQNSGELHKGELMVIDVGAEVSHYAADITRTISYGDPTERQMAVFDAVLSIQNYALSLLNPGTILKEYEQKVETYLGQKLQELGLIKTIEHDSVRKYYPHATSHFLGLDVHDVGDYKRPLEAGMVLTCEPGIYIPEEGIGVRIEDDVLITNTGNKVLSAALPRELSAYV